MIRRPFCLFCSILDHSAILRPYHGALSADGEAFESLDGFAFVKDLREEKDAIFREELDGTGSKAHQNRRPVRRPTQARSG